MKHERYSIRALLLAMIFSYGTSVTAQTERTIAFEGVENGRDLGGLVMQNGKVIRTGMLVRSGNLSKATDADVAMLKERFGQDLQIEFVVTNPTAGSHCGPNGVGIAFHAKHR